MAVIPRRIFCLVVLALAIATSYAQRVILPTVDDADSWPCLYYLLNYNSDFERAEACRWYGVDEDESEWMEGVGPFSNDPNKFLVGEWPSQLRPILIRRHFTLSADDLQSIKKGTLTLLCSYDENPKVYVNGHFLWSATGWNDNNYAEYTVTPRQKRYLQEGDNLLAVSLMQGEGGGHIDCGFHLSVPDGIDEVAIAEDALIPADYNLCGQKISSALPLSKGVYIKNGRKIIK